jgi:hypothetical protein
MSQQISPSRNVISTHWSNIVDLLQSRAQRSLGRCSRLEMIRRLARNRYSLYERPAVC